VIVAITDSEVASGLEEVAFHAEEVAMEQLPLLIFSVLSLALSMSFL
jgi:hypothetical protein